METEGTIPPRLAAAIADRYVLERELGVGGMATVYLAVDVRHSRRVAIKVLKPELAAVLGAERFLAEIRTTAKLQHPHILPLFESGEADGYLYYVMPFIEGESLRDRLKREQQLAVEDAVRIARDVADALDYAHRQGVIHRDIKPENILLHDGRPMVADFGIALAISAAGQGRMTETGLSLGTPHYMSPEQASAERDLTARSDIYALGCVLYEMLVGEPPHTGPNAAVILTRILTEQPRPIAEIRPTVPPNVASAVTKAIQKLPADRFHTASDFRNALGDPGFRFASATIAEAATPAVPRASGWDVRSTVFAGTALLLAGVAAWLAFGNRTSVTVPERGVVAFRLADSVLSGFVPAVGPGGWLAYNDQGQLYLRAPGSTEAVPVAGATPMARNSISFSPDGQWYTYAQPARESTILYKAPTRGGSPVSLATIAGVVFTPEWGDDGWIYVSLGRDGDMVVARVPENGGAIDTLLRTGLGVPYSFAKVPGEPVVFFGLFSARLSTNRVIRINPETRDTATVVPGGYHPVWSAATGHLLFARREGSVFAVPFDLRRLATTGPPVPVLDSLSEAIPGVRYALSSDGTLVYVAGPPLSGLRPLYTLRIDHLDGRQEAIPLPSSDHWDAVFSPDGRRIAYVRNDHIWVYDLDLGNHLQITRQGTRHHNPAWSPDGQRIAFSDAVSGRDDVDVFVTSADGSSAVEWFGGSDADDFPMQWLSGDSILVQRTGGRVDIHLVRRGDSTGSVVLAADWEELNPRVSPDGRWLAYISSEGGRSDLYVRSWPSLRNRVKVSEGVEEMATNSFPVWSRDSRTLMYHQGESVYAATVAATGDSLRVMSRRVVEKELRGRLMDLHPDGRRLLVMAIDQARDHLARRAPRRAVVITNWESVLRQRLQQ